MTHGDLDLLLQDVAADLDQLHAVEQGLRDRVQVVGRGDEEDLTQVVIDVEIVVVEGGVLLRVEHLEEGRCRVALKVAAHLIHLVEHEDGVRRARLLQVLQDAAHHGADVGASVASDLGLVVQAAQRDAHVFASQRFGHGSSERRLADARRAVEAEDGRAQVALELEHSQMFDDALLDLLHAVMIAVEDALGVRQAEVVATVRAPRQADDRLHVLRLDGVVGRLWVDALQLGQLLFERLADLLGPLFLLGLRAQLADLDVVHVTAQLLLDGLHLLLQEVLLLLLVDVLMRLHLDRRLELDQLIFAVEDEEEAVGAVLHIVDGQQLLLLVRVSHDVAAGEAEHVHRVLHVADGEDQLAGRIAGRFDHLYREILDGRDEGFILAVVFARGLIVEQRDGAV